MTNQSPPERITVGQYRDWPEVFATHDDPEAAEWVAEYVLASRLEEEPDDWQLTSEKVTDDEMICEERPGARYSDRSGLCQGCKGAAVIVLAERTYPVDGDVERGGVAHERRNRSDDSSAHGVKIPAPSLSAAQIEELKAARDALIAVYNEASGMERDPLVLQGKLLRIIVAVKPAISPLSRIIESTEVEDG